MNCTHRFVNLILNYKMSQSSFTIFILILLFIILLSFRYKSGKNEEKNSKQPRKQLGQFTTSTCSLTEDFIVNFTEAKYLANGLQGSVYTFRNDILKTQDFNYLDDKNSIQMFDKEIEILSLLSNSPEVVTMKNACYVRSENKVKYYILMEFCEEEFDSWLSRQPKTISNFYDILIHITTELLDINEHMVYHIDNHRGNLMICNNRLKFIDFGSGAIAKSPKNAYIFHEVRNLQILFYDVSKVFKIRNDDLDTLFSEMKTVGKYTKDYSKPKININDIHKRLIAQKNKYGLSNDSVGGLHSNIPLFVGTTNELFLHYTDNRLATSGKMSLTDYKGDHILTPRKDQKETIELV